MPSVAEVRLCSLTAASRPFTSNIRHMCFIVYDHPRAQLCFVSKEVSFLKPTNPCIFMPRISQENKQYYKSRIRSVLAQSPQITQRELKDRLEADGLTLDRLYLASLLNDIYAERTKRLDTVTLNGALAAFQDSMAEGVSGAGEIVNDQMAERNDVL